MEVEEEAKSSPVQENSVHKNEDEDIQQEVLAKNAERVEGESETKPIES